MSWYDEACCLVTRRGVGSLILASWVFVGRTLGLVALLGSREYESLLICAGLVLTLNAVLAWSTPAALGAGIPPHSGSSFSCRGVDHASIVIGFNGGIVIEDKEETFWKLEYATTASGPWSPVPGGEGTFTLLEVESASEQKFIVSPVVLGGLSAEVLYYVRALLTDVSGGETVERAECETVPLHPVPGGVEVLGVSGTSARVHSNVFPDGFETRWRFEYEASLGKLEDGEGLSGSEGTITLLEAEATPFDAGVSIEGELSGLSAGGTYYVRVFVEDEPELGLRLSVASGGVGFESAGGPVVSTFVVHAVHGGSVRVLGGVVAHGYDTHYYFQYVGLEEYDSGGWGKAVSAPPVDVGAGEFVQGKGFPTSVVGEDLAGLQAGGSYVYRLVATNSSPGNPVVDGAVETLTVPAVASATGSGGEPVAGGAGCVNEAFRSGASAVLPDCRAYEQVTPVDKQGSQEIFSYGIKFSGTGALPISEGVAEGEGLVLQNPLVDWGSAASDGQGPYFFARSRSGSGWLMKAAAVQPETGVNVVKPELYSADQSRFAFETGVETVVGEQSATVEYKVGPVGGPYTLVAVVPRKDLLEGLDGWVAASQDFSKLILQVADHSLPGIHSTGMTAGNDLYEYVGGQLRQVNVTGSGSTISAIGSCGAVIAHGHEGGEGGVKSSPRAVSVDGSRVFFEEVPGSDCSEPSHLYMRVDGNQTVDIGPYEFLAASADGSLLLLVKNNNGTSEIFSYDTETAAVKPLKGFVVGGELLAPLVSADLSTVYFSSEERLTGTEAPALAPGAVGNQKVVNLYRYSIATETLSFIAQTERISEQYSSADGRYFYFDSGGVGGLPGGSPDPLRNNGGSTKLDGHQVYRFDGVEDVVECLSCASPFDPEPRTGAFYGVDQGSGTLDTQDGAPGKVVSSENGDFAFFETPAALVPQDIDGEIAPETIEGQSEHQSFEENTSVSSDVYEWRGGGVDGCVRLQGCLSLLTSGSGGFLNLLIGSTESGNDVFIYTNSQLVLGDNDTAGDIYDVRIDGGFPPPPPSPVECEGDACSTPVSPPIDSTPSSFTFSGTGKLTPNPPVVVKPKKKPAVKCVKRKPAHAKCAKAKPKPRRKKAKTGRKGRTRTGGGGG
jgi:hypothetical protein